eukprot:TRINITY_DN8242_c0_g2_i2.p1 TRINITY_DN8242_c0_g2~~TRINITY_DN8242_c0_g2_i2.p1  ORF type:complete len:390 (+),score=44.92 TRINITY_DN8242_c0_g2_i2:581-1750(+)
MIKRFNCILFKTISYIIIIGRRSKSHVCVTIQFVWILNFIFVLYLVIVVMVTIPFLTSIKLTTRPMGQFISTRRENYSTNCLWERVGEVFERANQLGAATKFDSRVEIIRDEQYDVNFVVRLAPALAKKPKGNNNDNNNDDSVRKSDNKDAEEKNKKAAFNPFLPYDERLWIQHLSQTHTLLMNKFYIADHHVIVATRDFQKQTDPLNSKDLEAVFRVLKAYPGAGGLGFFNCGQYSGYSQPHKHVQVVPMPFDDESPQENRGTPFDAILEATLQGVEVNEVVPVSKLPFQAFCTRIQENSSGDSLEKKFEDLLQNVKSKSAKGNDLSFNLLFTKKWMMMVPRSAETHGPCSFNALGYAGTLVAKSDEDFQYVKSKGPMQILTELSFPW